MAKRNGIGFPWGSRKASSPLDLKFAEIERTRPHSMLAGSFTGLHEKFESSRGIRDYEQLAPGPERNPAEADRRNGTLTLSGDQPFFTLVRSPTHQAAPFSTVLVDVTSFAETGGEQDAVFAGLVKDEDNYVAAWFSRVTGAVGVDAVHDGVLTNLGALDTPIPASCRVGFTLTGRKGTVLIDTGEGLLPLLSVAVPDDLGLRRSKALEEYHNAFGARASSGAIVLGGVEAGYFGQAGLRDLHVVSHADGTPVIRYGKAYLTATHAGPGFFDTAHWGVWTLDLDNLSLEHRANLFFRRDGDDVVQGDHAGHIVRDEARDRWIVLTSTWGDFDGEHVDVHHTTVPLGVDLLNGTHVLDTSRLPLPTDDLPSPSVGQWDPHLVQVDDRWYLAFVTARRFFDFYPALASSRPGGDVTDLSLVGCDDDKVQTEGVVIQRVAGRWCVLASNGGKSPEEIREQFPVYDMTMRQVGTLDAPHPTNIPWPMIFPVPAARDRTRWLMVTFDGTPFRRDVLGYGTHGDVVVLDAGVVSTR